MSNERSATLFQGMLGRWILARADNPHLAWSGARWVGHSDGVPTGQFQICNFETADDALAYAVENGLHVAGVDWRG